MSVGNRDFALAAFTRLLAADDAEDNLLISPHSILSALAMVYAGAEGNTRRQMREALRFALDEPALHQAFEALDAALAERSRIERDDQARGFLYIGEVFHKTFIELDEAGTEAAAATAAVMMRPVEEEALVLRFDRPFIYAIYDHPTRSILFLGRLLDPVP